jgi:type IV secretory pathway VirD2 relaxase
MAMIFKTKNVKASRGTSAGKASSALKSHFKYIQYRERDELKESRQDRYLFSKEHDHIDRKDAHADIMSELAGDIYYHRMVLSPADNEPVSDWHQWTRDVMGDLERHYGTELHWYGVVHQNTDNPHVHVVLRGTGEDRDTGRATPVELTPKEFKIIRESGREHSEYEHYRQIQEVFKELDQVDTLEQDYLLMHQQAERTFEFDR